jgi:hypothetical protein
MESAAYVIPELCFARLEVGLSVFFDAFRTLFSALS